MKISETTSFPHPILAPWSSDIDGGTISTSITFAEDTEKGLVSVRCDLELIQADIRELIQDGKATFGCFIKCQETGVRRLQSFGFPTGTHEFAPGALLGNVYLRPLIWTLMHVKGYRPHGSHPEFPQSLDLRPGEILAIDEEHIIHVTRPPLPTIESIFEIVSSAEVIDGEFEIDTDGDKIVVRASPATYGLVQSLRQTDDATRAAVMNGLYVPVVMEVLDIVRSEGYDSFEGRRWVQPFRARCEQCEVDVENADLLSDAQKLLEYPFAALASMIDEEEGENGTAS